MKRTVLLSTGACLAALLLSSRCRAAEEVEKINPRGKPKEVEQGERQVLALWFENDKWHLSVKSEKGEKVHFHGRITVSDGQITDAGMVELERMKRRRTNTDYAITMPNKRGVDFSFANVGGLDGLTFKTTEPTAKIKFDLIMGRDEDPSKDPERILIGAEGKHPSGNPFLMSSEPPKRGKQLEKQDN